VFRDEVEHQRPGLIRVLVRHVTSVQGRVVARCY
jgi:hypothetical protein